MRGLDIDFTKLKLNNGLTIEQTLKAEAQRFVEILKNEIMDWYSSYNPAVYSRSFGMMNSIGLDGGVSVSVDAQHFSIGISYSGSALSPGLWGSGANKLLLMNSGYAVGSDKWFSAIPQFGYRSGGQFLEAALAKFNASNSMGIEVTANY